MKADRRWAHDRNDVEEENQDITPGWICGSIIRVLGKADMAAAKKWVDKEFQPSTLTKAEQMKEMEWFVNAAKPFKGMHIKVVSETIPTHEYEAKVLAKAFGFRKVMSSKSYRPSGRPARMSMMPILTIPISSAPTCATGLWFP
jgi:hypothetical protein